MSFYNFKLNDPSTFSTSTSPNSKNAGRFVHKTFNDFQHKGTIAPKLTMTPDGQRKFSTSSSTPEGQIGRFRVNITSPNDNTEEIADVPEEIRAISITSSLQSITHTFASVEIASLYSLGSPTSIRIVKLSGQSAWHSHNNTDDIFIVLRGAINMLYRSGKSGTEKVARVVGGELLNVPMRMEHCIVADEGTEVLLLEGSDAMVPLS
jgi:mannose-6-phosphate isomerase-like protein (cupin superfamily)